MIQIRQNSPVESYNEVINVRVGDDHSLFMRERYPLRNSIVDLCKRHDALLFNKLTSDDNR